MIKGLLNAVQAIAVQENRTGKFEETVIELFDRDGNVLYEAFPDSSPEDLSYAVSYLREGQAFGGYYYPPYLYPVGTQSDHEQGLLESSADPISFDDEAELLAILKFFESFFR